MLHKPSESICAEMNALPQPSAFGINELTTDLVLRCVVDEFELLACGCVCKLLERRVDEARDGGRSSAAGTTGSSDASTSLRSTTGPGDAVVLVMVRSRCCADNERLSR